MNLINLNTLHSLSKHRMFIGAECLFVNNFGWLKTSTSTYKGVVRVGARCSLFIKPMFAQRL